MTVRRALLCITLVAIVHGLFFIWYQRPDWNTTSWPDQAGYRRLGQVLAATGKFTPFPDAVPFVPEVLRMPAYPAFVAVIYTVAGVHQLPVALAQTGLFALICLLVFGIARRMTSERVALRAALVTALFPPIPYFGALVMTEVWTTFLFTLSIWVAVRALDSRRTAAFAAAGVLMALTTLSRPIFVLFPVALAAVGLVVFPVAGVKRRPSLLQWAALVGAFTIAMVPWSMYNYVTMGRFTPTPPAGGVGRGLWEGQWQATWSGRLQDELTKIADATDDRALLDERVNAVAAREHTAAAPMLEYVHQWQDIRRIWTEATDPRDHGTARVADREYQRVAVDNLRKESMGHLARRLSRGVFILWAGEIPVRYSQINQLPPLLIHGVLWGAQAVICLAALAGFAVLYRSGRKAEALLFGSCLLYVTAVHLPLLKEARQSLPAQPVVLILASLAFKTQVHEGEHLG